MYVIRSDKPNAIAWDSAANKALCKFKDGIFETQDEALAMRLGALGYAVKKSGGVEPGGSPASVLPECPDYFEMEENELAAIARQNGIDIEGKTKRQVINALKRGAR